jgi:hypothetical protein
LGAASPLNLGLTRRPDKAAFGPDCHPAALLESSRANATAPEWWVSQLSEVSPSGNGTNAKQELALAEWCLALWCVADPNVVVELFHDWERVLLELPEGRRRPVIDAALRCSAHGWIEMMPSAPSSDETAVRAMLELRNPMTPQPQITSTFTPRSTPIVHDPLIEVARVKQWFKVDTVGAYR